MSEEQLFIEALEISNPAGRVAFLEAACGGRTDLFRRMGALLRAHDSAGAFLETPASKDVVAAAADGLTPGAVIDRYRIVRLLGEGGMGAVYLADQIEPVCRRVALKLVRPGLASAHVLTRFEAERQTLAIMDHPNIARVLDAGTTGQGQPYFVMELIEGSPITEYCNTHHLPLRARLELVVFVCRAVQHAHQKGILHRDLKPTNILILEIDGKPTPKIIDFGVAKALSHARADQQEPGAAGVLEGTLEYMSPEQAQPDPLDVDSRSDVYSLGVLLYELLTGTTPLRRELLRAGAAGEAPRVIREVEPPAPSALLQELQDGLDLIAHQRNVTPARLRRLVQGELDWVVMKALCKDRNQRYDTALGLGLDLQRYLADEPVQAATPRSSYRIKKFMRKHRAVVSTAAAGVLALLGVTVFSVWLAYRATQAEAKAQEERLRATVERNRAYVAESEASRQRDNAMTAQRQALDEAAGARAVLDFLVVDLFMETDPEKHTRAKPVTVEELMDRAAARVPGKLEEQPRTEAMIRQVMGVMYRKLGNLPAAQTHLERALELRQSHLGEDHDHTLNTMDALAVVYDRQQKKRQAEELMRRSFENARSTFGNDHLQTRTKMANLGVLLLQSGKLREAEPLLLQSYQLNRSQFGEDHATTLTSLHNLAVLLMEQGKLDESEQLFGKILQARRTVLGEEHPRTASSMHMLAVANQFRGKHEPANALYEECLHLSQKVLGPDHSGTLNTIRCLASNHESMGHPTQAESLYKEVLKKLSQSSPSDPGLEAEVLLSLGHNLIQQKRYEEALDLLRRSAELWNGMEQPAWGKTYHQLLTAAALLGRRNATEGTSQVRLGCQRIRESLEPTTRRAKLNVLNALVLAARLCEQENATPECETCQEQINWLRRQLEPVLPPP